MSGIQVVINLEYVGALSAAKAFASGFGLYSARITDAVLPRVMSRSYTYQIMRLSMYTAQLGRLVR